MHAGDDSPDPSDLELLDRIALGGARAEASFAVLVGRYEARVYGMSLKMLGDAGEAQDAFQDTFLTVFRKAEGFRRESRFSTWLYRVTANHCLMRLRKRARRKTSPASELPEGSPALDPPDDRPLADAAFETEEGLAALRTAIDELPEPYRTAVVLRDVEGLSLAEICAATGDSVAALKSRIHRGRLQLRARMHEIFGNQPGIPSARDKT